ncbi:unnamed protein product [Phytophthora fragariaefolia]|uniref:Unnamed protein product n=1 Tax=Phytophthora fragariaefolia TaxID=1490495 RepID=A0A9W6UA54_9STRA|nr:unnamed protein product [Phytophthora fragariaefolia]
MAPLAEASAPPAPALEPATLLKHKAFDEEPQSEAPCDEDSDDIPAETAKLRDDDATAAAQLETAHLPPKKRVRFDTADVIEFEPTMWTATRVDRQEYMEVGYLEPEERLDILENAGHSISIISHVERETLRINRERWESNEYDLMYQYGLGEVPLMEDGDMEMMVQQDEGDDIMHVDDSGDEDFFFGGSSRSMIVDSEMRFAMEDMDAYDAVNTRTYDDLSIDYASDCILGDDESSDENNELPYAVDSFDSPLSCDLLEMGTSPSDVSGPTDLLAAATAASCAQSAVAATSAASSTSTESATPAVPVEASPVVAV